MTVPVVNPVTHLAIRGRARRWTTSDLPAEPPSTELDLVDILSAVEETAYIWDFKTDRIDWESNASKVLGVLRSRRRSRPAAGSSC